MQAQTKLASYINRFLRELNELKTIRFKGIYWFLYVKRFLYRCQASALVIFCLKIPVNKRRPNNQNIPY